MRKRDLDMQRKEEERVKRVRIGGRSDQNRSKFNSNGGKKYSKQSRGGYNNIITEKSTQQINPNKVEATNNQEVTSNVKKNIPTIPGFYYDEKQNRYFKITKFHKPPQNLTPQEIADNAALKIKQAKDEYASTTNKTSNVVTLQRQNLLFNREISNVTKSAFIKYTTEGLYSSRNVQKLHNLLLPSDDATNVNDIQIDRQGTFMLTGTRVGWACLYQLERDLESVSNPKITLKYRSRRATDISSIRWCKQDLPLFSLTELGSSSYIGALSIYDTSFNLKYSFTLRKGSIWTSEWAHTGDKISIGITAGSALVDTRTHKFVRLWTGKSDVFYQQFTSDDNILLNGCRNGKIYSFDLRAPDLGMRNAKQLPLMIHNSSVSCLKLLKDENYLLSSSMDGKVHLWDRRKYQNVLSFEAHSDINSVILTKFQTDESENFMFGGTPDRFVRIWNIKSGKLLNYIGPFQEVVKTVGYHERWKYNPTSSNSHYQPGFWVVNSGYAQFYSAFV